MIGELNGKSVGTFGDIEEDGLEMEADDEGEDCPECDGAGCDDDSEDGVTCDYCGGSGVVYP